ncbi:MAG: single-stranded DNA-binding protein [Candidatus Obscuribacterales bacterium]|nr:single-stranded DNA-binding protein [Candidatus Obscuribacterales bacterium]
MSLSKIVVSGRVVRSPEKRFTPSTNIAVTEFAIAVESPARGDQPAETAVVKVVTWRDLAERCATEIRKGDMVAVDGRLQINNSQSSDGQRKREVEVDAVAVENLTALVAGTSSSSGQPTDEPADRYAKSGAKSAPKPSAAPKAEDIDAIFSSDDEIPF